MITTKRYDYVPIDSITEHPDVLNHRIVNESKVAHYAKDIAQNGLLEPLVVWERNPGEFFLVGGFHRVSAMRRIRAANPGHFDRVDVRVVGGNIDEMRALNLKLNADRLELKITDYFDTILYLNNANWTVERIAEFLDKSVSWIQEILRYAPAMPEQIRCLLSMNQVSWRKARAMCQAIQSAPPGSESEELMRQLETLESPESEGKPKRPFTLRQAKNKFTSILEEGEPQTYQLTTEDLLSLLLVVEGKEFTDEHQERLKQRIPALFEKKKRRTKKAATATNSTDPIPTESPAPVGEYTQRESADNPSETPETHP